MRRRGHRVRGIREHGFALRRRGRHRGGDAVSLASEIADLLEGDGVIVTGRPEVKQC